MTSTLPQAASEVTPAWLGEVLGGTVSSLHVEPIGPLEGVNSEVSRLHLDGRHRDLPSRVIFKVPAANAGARGVAAYQRWYEREVGFYQRFASDTPIRTPEVYLAQLEADGRYALLLEDLDDRPQGDQIAGCSAEAAHAAVTAAAELHARFWNVAEPEAHEWLPATTVGLDRAGPVAGAFARGWSLRRDIAPSALRPVVDRAVEHYPDLIAAAATPPLTLIHGDYRLDNMFLEPSGQRLAVIDWQFISRCRGVYDVAYFLGLSLEVDERRAHEAALLDVYRERLAAAGVDYDAEAIALDYRLSLMLSYAVFCIGAMGQDPTSRVGLMHEVGLERLGAAILDQDMDGAF